MILAVLLCTSACVHAPAAVPHSHVRYESITRTGYYSFEDGTGTFGLIQPATASSSQLPVFSDDLGKPIYDCSNSEYLCLRTWFRVFAVPHRSISGELGFTVGGAQIRVEQCIRESDRGCQVAVLRADCELMIGLDECGAYAGGREKSPAPGPVTYFVYNEDYGITAFGTSSVIAEDPQQQLMIATQLVLQGSVGLLKAPLVAVAPE